ncbi:MAG: porin family protein [Ginsengibacter sp.]
MKTKIISFAILLFMGSSAFSQTFKLGIKGGANLGKISGQSFKDQFSLGYHVGGFATIGLGNKFAIQPEVLFNQVNNDTTTSFSDVFKVKNVSSIQLKYLSIPVLLNYNINKYLKLQAGPQFGILLNENDNLLQTGNNAFKSGNFSLVGGLQLDLLKFRVYGRFVGGQTDISNLSSSNTWKTSAIQLGVGLAL